MLDSRRSLFAGSATSLRSLWHGLCPELGPRKLIVRLPPMGLRASEFSPPCLPHTRCGHTSFPESQAAFGMDTVQPGRVRWCPIFIPRAQWVKALPLCKAPESARPPIRPKGCDRIVSAYFPPFSPALPPEVKPMDHVAVCRVRRSPLVPIKIRNGAIGDVGN